MSVPLLTSSKSLAEMAATTTPRFSALLACVRPEQSMVVDQYRPAGEPAHLTRPSVLAAWATGATLLGALAAAQPAAPVDEPIAHRARSIMPGLADIYDRWVTPRKDGVRLRTAEQQLEDLAPAAPGTTSAAAAAEHQARRQSEEMVLAAGIVAGAFENRVDRKRTNGTFDVQALSQVQAAAKIIAPGKTLSEMSPLERLAVATAATAALQGPFIDQMRIQEPRDFANPSPQMKSLLAVAGGTRDAAAIADEFTLLGKFSPERFLGAVGPGPADQKKAASPNSAEVLKQVLLSSALYKGTLAVNLVYPLLDRDKAGEQTQQTQGWAETQVRALRMSLDARRERLEDRHAPSMTSVPSASI